MQYGICNLSIVPCRAEASDKSEMVTQLLFGEHFQIIETQKKWLYIRTAYDNYDCWIDANQCMLISEETYNELQEIPMHVAADMIQLVTHKEKQEVLPIVMGSTLPFYDGESINLQGVEFLYEGQANSPKSNISKNQLIEFALSYLNTPYLWGGRSPFGIDCSGFTQLVYKLVGIKIPRDAYQQAEIGTTLSFVEEAEPGDLAFFDNELGQIIHVGIVMADGYIIHASGKVRIDRLDHYGIFNRETHHYTHNLRILKRIL